MRSIVPRRQSDVSTERRTTWDPFEMMREMLRWEPFREFEPMMRPTEGVWTPAFDVKETKEAFLFKADVPGLKEEDLDISITGNRLTVTGKREEEKKEEDEKYYSYERSYGSFSRTFTLPEGVDLEHIRAEMKEGVLTLNVPKLPEVQPKRISISGEQKAKA